MNKIKRAVDLLEHIIKLNDETIEYTETYLENNQSNRNFVDMIKGQTKCIELAIDILKGKK